MLAMDLGLQTSMSYGYNVSGSTELSNHSFENLTVSGSADLKDLKIDKDLIVSGAVTAVNVTANNMSVSGSAALENIELKNNLDVSGAIAGSNIKVIGKTKISGEMTVSEGHFSDIEINSKTLKLIDSKAHNILMLNSDSKQKLELKGSTISGDVTFKSGKGEIYLDNNSKILGKIEGGNVIKK